jgi:hypothetical protein
MNRDRLLVCCGLLLATSGCASPQAAEPLSSSVPVAAALGAAGGGALLLLVRWAWRRLDRSTGDHPALDAPLRFPQTTAVALLGPPVAVGVLLLTAGCWAVAFGYVDEQVTLLSWEDTVVLTSVGAAAVTVITSVAAAVGVAVTSRQRTKRTWGRTALVLIVVAGGLLTQGVLLVWLPALVLSLVARSSLPQGAPPAPTAFSGEPPRH